MKLLRGSPLATKIYTELAKQVRDLASRYATPQLAIIVIGNDPASLQYISIKKKQAESIGITVKVHKLAKTVSEQSVLDLIRGLNEDKHVTGILVQMPVPSHIAKEKIVWAIDPYKDVDGFQMREFLPPAPMAILELLQHYGIAVAKKKMLIIGKGFLVGKPLAVLAIRHGARVTAADYSTANLNRLVDDAQIIVTATGQPNLLSGGIFKQGQVVIDAGGGYVNGEFVSEIDHSSLKRTVGAVTPNPGGIGPLTVALLLRNVVKAATKTKVKQL